MGLGSTVKSIWSLIQGNLYQQLEGAKVNVGSHGIVFFVDPVAGNNGNNGRTPATAFATTPYALTQCTANAGDVIVRMPGNEYSDEGGIAAGAAIAMNVRGVTLIGLNIFNPDMSEAGANYGRYDSTLGWGGGGALGPVFEITAPCNIIGLNVVCDHAFGAGASGGGAVPDTMPLGVAIAVNGWQGGFLGSYNYIAQCRFPNWGGAEGINLFGSSYNLIEDCIFEGMSACGVHVDAGFQNSNYNRIKRCQFRTMVNGIQNTGGVRRTYVEECMFEELTGSGIQGVAAINGGHAFGNWFGLSETAGAAGAYDANLAARNAVNFHCAGNHYIDEPVPTQGATDPTS